MTTAYLAGPLFSLAEQEFNARLADELQNISPNLSVILPQLRAKKLLQQHDGMRLVFTDCLRMIDECDAVIGLLDGSDADSGTCIELGYARAHQKLILGVRTDFRISEDRGLNLMVSHVCNVLLLVRPANTHELAVQITDSMQKLLAVS